MRLLALTLLTTLALAAPARAGGTEATLRLLNDARAAHGLRPLRLDPQLARAARAHSRDMVKRRYFDHVSPSGTGLRTRVARTGWMRGRPRWLIAEDIGWGTGSLARPAEMVAAWMASPPHRHNILDAHLRVVGIGIARGTPVAHPGATFTADFGSR
jgi:uncharacterized protein YkwD